MRPPPSKRRRFKLRETGEGTWPAHITQFRAGFTVALQDDRIERKQIIISMRNPVKTGIWYCAAFPRFLRDPRLHGDYAPCVAHLPSKLIALL